jgi:hypothetical protein
MGASWARGSSIGKPNCFFHKRDGEHWAKDEEESVFEDIETAASEARASAWEWALQIMNYGQKINGQVIEMIGEEAKSASPSLIAWS